MNPPVSSLIPRLQERFLGLLPLIYFGYALPIAVAFALINPPFQVPDETNHFFRVVQISEGHLFGSRSPDPKAELDNTSGGVLFRSARAIASPSLMELHSDVNKKFDPAAMRRDHIFELPWGTETQFVSFSNTAIYPFTNYLPGAIGMALARSLRLTVIESFFTARLLTALASVIMAAVAIHLVSRGKLLFTCVLSLPTPLFLFGSLSQDAMLIAYSALAVGLLNRFLDGPDPLNPLWNLAAIYLLLTAVVVGRPPYLPFLFIGMIIAGHGKTPRRSVWMGGALALAAIVTMMLVIKHLGIFNPNHVDYGQQLSDVLHHPGHLLYLMLHTSTHYFFFYLSQFIGRFGWAECKLPMAFYPLIAAMLVVASLSTFKLKDALLPVGSRVAVPILCLGVVVLIYAANYITWNFVTATIIEGASGRYLIPAALMLTLVAGNRDKPGRDSLSLRACRLGANIIPLLAIVMTDIVACFTCLARYYY